MNVAFLALYVALGLLSSKSAPPQRPSVPVPKMDPLSTVLLAVDSYRFLIC